jgi:hypothetical protein
MNSISAQPESMEKLIPVATEVKFEVITCSEYLMKYCVNLAKKPPWRLTW